MKPVLLSRRRRKFWVVFRVMQVNGVSETQLAEIRRSRYESRKADGS